MSVAAHLIRPHIDRAFAERPDLVQRNVSQSVGMLLQLALLYAGSDWNHVAKSNPTESGFIPDGFVPYKTDVVRPDGQLEPIIVHKYSHDAAFHLPTGLQVKVITNSAANESPDPAIHGPAKTNSYDIDRIDYRYTNPPAPQVKSLWLPKVVTPTPAPAPSQPPATGISQQAFADGFRLVNQFYAAKDGLQRVGGMLSGVDASVFKRLVEIADGTITDEGEMQRLARAVLGAECDVQAMIEWGWRLIHGQTIDQIEAAIKQSDEWKAKHASD